MLKLVVHVAPSPKMRKPVWVSKQRALLLTGSDVGRGSQSLLFFRHFFFSPVRIPK